MARVRVSFEAFLAGQAAQYRAQAAKIYRRWTLPAGCSVEDVYQEILMGAWRAWGRWWDRWGDTEEKPMMSLAAYCGVSALQDAKRWVMVQRNTARRSTKAPARYADCESSFAALTEEGLTVIDAAEVDPVAEQAVYVAEAIGMLGDGASPIVRAALQERARQMLGAA